jgi:hypothetical protein
MFKICDSYIIRNIYFAGCGVTLHTCNPRLRRLRQEDHKFEANLSYITRFSLKKKKVP